MFGKNHIWQKSYLAKTIFGKNYIWQETRRNKQTLPKAKRHKPSLLITFLIIATLKAQMQT